MLTFKGNNKRIENLYLLAYLRYDFYVNLQKKRKEDQSIH